MTVEKIPAVRAAPAIDGSSAIGKAPAARYRCYSTYNGKAVRADRSYSASRHEAAI